MGLFKTLAKEFIYSFPIALTRNEQYDRLTLSIIKKVCQSHSVCIDIGAHKGRILQQFLRTASQARHWAFEPIPELFHHLKKKFGSAAHIYDYALSNIQGKTSFNLVVTDMAYSGLRKRKYDKPEEDKVIEVRTELLDHIIPASENITLIKMDVEGAELMVLQGAIKTIHRNKPVILFEFGKAGSEAYGYDDNLMYDFIDHNLYYNIYTLKSFYNNHPSLTKQQFHQYYLDGKEFFFVAAPK